MRRWVEAKCHIEVPVVVGGYYVDSEPDVGEREGVEDVSVVLEGAVVRFETGLPVVDLTGMIESMDGAYGIVEDAILAEYHYGKRRGL